MNIVTGEKEFFKGIGQVNYEGQNSDNGISLVRREPYNRR